MVVGLGNDVAGDDGVGIHVATSLASKLRGRRDVEVIPMSWAGFDLLDVLRGRARAALVDAIVTGDRPPGTVVSLTEEGYGGSIRLNSFHDIPFRTVMAFGRELGWGMPGEVAIWGIEAEHIGEFTEQLSPSVASAAERVVDEVLRFVGAARGSVRAMGVTA